MKSLLLRGSIGRAALFCRAKFEMFRGAAFNLEGVGTLANDQLATDLITRICDSHRTFVDIGAHIGSIVYEVKRRDSSIRVIAIEAIPAKVESLKKRFSDIEIHGCAVGNHSGTVSFYVNREQSGYSSLKKPSNSDQQLTVEITVPMERVDALITQTDVDAIKIDVEGAELEVLRGSARLLETSRPIILFESAPQEEDSPKQGEQSGAKEQLFVFLTQHNYSVYVPNRVAHEGHGLTLWGFLDSHLFPRRTTNYFAIPNERRTEFREKARRLLKIR